MMKTHSQNAMELAFRKAVEANTAYDKEAIKNAILGNKPGPQPAPRQRNVPIDNKGVKK